MKFLIISLLFISCHNKTYLPYFYEESKYLEDGTIRNVKYWIDENGNVQGQIDTVKTKP